MVPLTRYTFAGGIPITQLIKKERLEQICSALRDGGLDTAEEQPVSAYYARCRPPCRWQSRSSIDKNDPSCR